MELVCKIILFVCWFGIAFCVGYTFQLKRNLAKLAELREDFERLRQLSAEADASADACIMSLERDNEVLRRQLAAYREKEEHNDVQQE